MAVPPGSFTQALRVGSGRGPTLRTALRGATSERVKHATGFTFSGRCDHQDHQSPGGASPPKISPDMSPEMSPPSRISVRSPTEAARQQDSKQEKPRKRLSFFGLRDFRVQTLWRANSRNYSEQRHYDTSSGNVNQHAHIGVSARCGSGTGIGNRQSGTA